MSQSGTEDVPPLRFLHPDSYRGGLAKISLEFWRTRPTDAIIESLRPGSREVLLVKPDGTIMNGNTRVMVLLERGIDIHALPHETHV